MLLAVYLFRRQKDGVWTLALGYLWTLGRAGVRLPSPKEGTLTLPLPCHKAPSSPAHQVCLPPFTLPLCSPTTTTTTHIWRHWRFYSGWVSLPLISSPSGLSGTQDSCWQAASEQPSCFISSPDRRGLEAEARDTASSSLPH